MKYFLSILIFTTIIKGIDAQIFIQSFLDIGENNISEGTFIKNVYRCSYKFQQYYIETGTQFSLQDNNPNTLTGFDISGLREFKIKNTPYNVKGFFMLNRFSDLMYETNWGFTCQRRMPKHLFYELGTNFKTYTINKASQNEYHIDKKNSKLRENFNLIYVFTGYLKPNSNHWNIGLSFTNVDYYVINQSTNPVFNVQMRYKTESEITIYTEAWYKQAGILNINANYFGYFFRGGILWKI